ncbi:cob(I)yrinic acid a,c-diamide adenosyltransferase [Steroidobacter agaridevorans]|uniref:cob(I)yrinic acid a,c-diamide adenosyltransferase n=1 Tax=Steroidobacter agaridevorans TaxID=2695856 RepID=UPI0013282794|nr:cob(I)yrinic acid a,c-diamide adenosyltransferase [Steroidobacter agaridevorans]GFE88757.1 cob(I)yrinic acid a,c-diamide adenosyltransferase [Steroidobacter agaridevorans]
MSTPTDGLSEAEKDRLHAEEMRLRQAERRAERATKKERGGLLMILTGPGKGKSSSAFGMVARALGWDMRIGIVQFIKGKWQTGEKHFFRRFPELVTFEVMGEGFTWDVQDRQRDIAAAQKAWQRGCELIVDPEYDFVLLDELNIAIRNDYVSIDEVVAFLKNRPRDKHICITGRDARPQLTEIADLVTEMTLIKHPYEAGFKPQRGVEF